MVELVEVVIRVMQNDWHTLVRGVNTFDNKFANYDGVKDLIGVVNNLDTSISAFPKFTNNAMLRLFPQT